MKREEPISNVVNQCVYISPEISVIEVEVEGMIASSQLSDYVNGDSAW